MKNKSSNLEIKLNGNKKIAEFMGGKYISHKFDGAYYKFEHPVKNKLPDNRIVCVPDFNYHTSWDSLMEVWFKLSDTIRSSKSPFASSYGAHEQSFFAGIHEHEISISWQAIVEIIDWYNKNVTNK